MNERQQNRDRPADTEGQLPATVEPMPEAMTAEADGREAPKNLTGRFGSADFASRDEASSPQDPDSGCEAVGPDSGRSKTSSEKSSGPAEAFPKMPQAPDGRLPEKVEPPGTDRTEVALDGCPSPQAPVGGKNAPVREGGRKAGGENSLPASDEPARAESDGKKRCAPVRLILWGWGLLTAPNRLGEILRFCLVGGVATLIDFAVMALLLWAFEPEAYPTFWDLFTGGDPSPLVSAVASALGFLSGHIFSDTASVRFVCRDNARGRTKKGFVVFTLIALFCLLLHAVGMYACRALFELNEWLVKAVLTVLVTALGYVLKKKILF